MQPLAGITILDCTRVLAGPLCTMLLADLGADVIKVEQPGRGDETRAWGPPFVGGESPYFWSINRNKRSLTLDLAHAEGRAIFARLIARCQVLVENFKTGTLDRWGWDDAALWRINPALVHTVITAYGSDGPRAADPGYDVLMQAEAGWMSVTGVPEGAPMKVGMALVDVLTGQHAATATLAALRVAETTQQGQRVECALLRSAIAGLINVASGYLATRQEPQRWGNAHATIVPYQLFQASDHPFVLAVGNDAQWRRCCEALDQIAWADDPRFASNPQRVAHRAALVALLDQLFRSDRAAVWIERLRVAGVPCSAVNSVADVFNDPQMQQQQITTTIDHHAAGPIELLNPPFVLSATPASVRLPPPTLGQHTDAILHELGYASDQIARWRAAGTV